MSLKHQLGVAIEELIIAGECRDALVKLRQLAIDFAPEKRPEVSQLLSRINAYDRESRQGRSRTENINDITAAALATLQEIVESTSETVWPFLAGAHDSALESDKGSLSAKVDSDNLRFRTIQNGISASLETSFIVCATEIRKTYATGTFALGPISLELQPGRITVIVGRNGSGKSTLLRIIAGQLLQSAGTMTYPFLSKIHDWSKIKPQISYITFAPVVSSYKIRDTLEYLAATSGERGEANRLIVDDYLNRYDLRRYAALSWSDISTGYLMRFHLIRALITKPKLLLLDEPLANLDVGMRTSFLTELVELTRTFSNPMGVVVSSHHVSEAEIIADDLVVLENGKSRFFGTKQELRELVRGSIFHVVGNISVEVVRRFTNEPGLRSVRGALGGVMLYFDDVISIEHVIERLGGSREGRVASITDLSGSTLPFLE